MKVLTKKVTKLLAAALMATLLAVGLTACGGKSNEDVIREGVTADFASVKNFDADSPSEAFGDLSSITEFEQFGITPQEFLGSWLKGFDYKIGDITVDGDNATVKASVTIKSFGDAMTSFQDKVTELSKDPDIQGMSQSEAYEKMGGILMECIDEAPLTTTDVELPYVLNNNEWGPGADFNSKLGGALYGDAFGAL